MQTLPGWYELFLSNQKLPRQKLFLTRNSSRFVVMREKWKLVNCGWLKNSRDVQRCHYNISLSICEISTIKDGKCLLQPPSSLSYIRSDYLIGDATREEVSSIQSIRMLQQITSLY